MPIERSVVWFLFAHPDDEFFCSAFLAEEMHAGAEIHCAYLTDGGYGGQSVHRRMNESLRVLNHYGIAVENVHFVGVENNIPDGFLPQHLEKALRELDGALVSRPTRIYTPAWEGGHQDHDVCHAIALHIATKRSCSNVYQFALYNGYDTRAPWFRVMSPLRENGPVEVLSLSPSDVLQCLANGFAYPSQWRTWAALLPFAAARMVKERRIVRQRASLARLSERPHSGALLYERRGIATFDHVQGAVRKLFPGLDRDG